MAETIGADVQKAAEDAQKANDEAVEQKKNKVSEQLQAATDQVSAAATKAAEDAQAKVAEANRKLAELPKEIEKTIKEIKDKLDSLLGKKLPDTADPNNIDFDPNAVMAPMQSAVQPVVAGISPIESVVGKVPVLGDLMGLMTKMSSQSSPKSLTKEDIKKLVPEPPELPDSLMNSINGLVDDVEDFCKQLPMLLIDVIFQMLGAIYDMFDQIVGIIGVPPAIFPFSLIKSVPPLMPKVEKLATQAPTQAKNIVVGVAKQKYAESMALAVPEPPVSASAVAGAANSAADSAASAASSSIPSTPQVQPVAPKEPIATEVKPYQNTWHFHPKGVYSPTGQFTGETFDIKSDQFSEDEINQILSCKTHIHSFKEGFFSSTWYEYYCDCPLGKKATELASSNSDWKETVDEYREDNS